MITVIGQWTGAVTVQPGDRLTLTFDVEKGGEVTEVIFLGHGAALKTNQTRINDPGYTDKNLERVAQRIQTDGIEG